MSNLNKHDLTADVGKHFTTKCYLYNSCSFTEPALSGVMNSAVKRLRYIPDTGAVIK
jgi:hypothetical protein